MGAIMAFVGIKRVESPRVPASLCAVSAAFEGSALVSLFVVVWFWTLALGNEGGSVSKS
jgi:hypothetical protein